MKKALVLLCLLAAVSCKRGGCPEGAYKSDDQSFCMVLPAGWKGNPPIPRPESGLTELSFSSGDGVNSFGLIYAVKRTYDELLADAKKSVEFEKKSGTVEQGEMDGGRGYWTKVTKPKSAHYVFLYKLPKGPVQCDVSSYGNDVTAQLNACKSVASP
jgi:hypothetical protein